MRTWVKYLIYQLPGWVIVAGILTVLKDREGLSYRVAAGVFLLWLVKDFALYPFLKKSFESGGKTPVEQMIGLKGVARDRIDPHGYIQVRGELWRAEIHPQADPIPAGGQVKVVETNGLILVVVNDG